MFIAMHGQISLVILHSSVNSQKAHVVTTNELLYSHMHSYIRVLQTVCVVHNNYLRYIPKKITYKKWHVLREHI